MKRIFNKETIKNIGQKARVAGWINSRRVHGKVLFIDLRDKSGILQVVFGEKNKEIYTQAQELRPEWVVEITGTVQKRPEGMINPEIETGEIELQAESIKILAKSEQLPFDIQELKVSLPTLLDYRPLTFRNQKIMAIFKIEDEIINSFRKTLRNLQFTEFQAPLIVPTNAEGGAAVFRIDYYDYDAYLTQSPQLYKQIMLNGFERVFTVNKVFRAEPSVTTRHLAEYTSLDMEMAFIDSWEDLMEIVETVIRNMLSDVKNNCSKELKILGAVLPQLSDKFPQFKMREAQQIIFERTKRNNRKEPDLEPADEKEICDFAKEKYGSEVVFITHYPTKKRPFYTHPDPADEEYTLSFDLLCRGLEVITGGQRINDYAQLISNIKKWGNDPKDFEYYLQTFKYGMPPEGGFAIGSERVVKQLLGLENVREASLFPRDMERIDGRMSLMQPKKKTTKTKGEKQTKKTKK